MKLTETHKIAYLVRVLRYQDKFLDSITRMYLLEQENPYFTSEEEYEQLVLDIQTDAKTTRFELEVLRKG